MGQSALPGDVFHQPSAAETRAALGEMFWDEY